MSTTAPRPPRLVKVERPWLARLRRALAALLSPGTRFRKPRHTRRARQ